MTPPSTTLKEKSLRVGWRKTDFWPSNIEGRNLPSPRPKPSADLGVANFSAVHFRPVPDFWPLRDNPLLEIDALAQSPGIAAAAPII
jgi:hypothetical protein